MWSYVGRRLVLAIPTLLGASIIVFAMVHLAPGDPIAAVLPVDASKEQVEEIKKAYGFDQPLPVQYLKWLGHVVTGDLGKSIATRRAVILDVRDSLANSLVLAVSSSLLAFSAGIALGLLDAFRQGRDAAGDRACADPARRHRAGRPVGRARHPRAGVRARPPRQGAHARPGP